MMRRWWSLAALLVCCCATATEVDWSLVPDSAPDRSEVKATCMCDLTVRCDASCCCDPDCTEFDINDLFVACKKEVAGTDFLVKCADDTQATSIITAHNSPQLASGKPRLQDERLAQEPVAKDAVCVVHSNLRGLQGVYTLPDDDTVEEAAPEAMPVWPSRDASTDSRKTFIAGDRLPILRAVPTGGTTYTLSVEGAGYLSDPRPVGSRGVCSSDVTSSFLETNPLPQDCLIEGSNLATLCGDGGALNPNSAKFFAITAPDWDVSVTVPATHVVRNALTDAVLEEVDASAVFSDPTGTDIDPTAGAGGAVYDAAAGTCTNAIRRRKLTIVYQHNEALQVADAILGATISSVTVEYYVETVSQAADELYWVGYETVYVASGAESVAAASPSRSGNPGYVSGARVLAGAATTEGDKSAVIPRPRGFSVPFGGLCSERAHMEVRFKHNVHHSSCTVELDSAEFEALCLSDDSTTSLIQDALSPYADPTQCASSFTPVDRLGYVANAQFNAANDWITVGGSPLAAAATAGQFRRDLRQCRVTAGVQWVIAYSKAGELYNPQDVIVGATATPIERSWRFANSTAGNRQQFELEFDVYFVPVESGKDPVNIVPPAIFEVEEDIFFPFRRGQQDVKDN